MSLKEVETETRILHVKQHPYMGEFHDKRDHSKGGEILGVPVCGFTSLS